MTGKNTSALKTVGEIITQLQSLGEEALEQLLRHMNYIGIVLGSNYLPEEKDFKSLLSNPPPQAWPGSVSKDPTIWLSPATYLDEMVDRETAMWQRFGITLSPWELKCYRNYVERIGYLKMCYLRSWGYDVCLIPRLRVTVDAPHWEYQDILPLDLDCCLHVSGDRCNSVDRDQQECIYVRDRTTICIVETSAIPETCEMPLNDLLKEAVRRTGSKYHFWPVKGMIQWSEAFDDIDQKIMFALRNLGINVFHPRLENYMEAMILDHYLAQWPRTQRKTSVTPVWLHGYAENNVSRLALVDGKLRSESSPPHPRIERAYGRSILTEDLNRYEN